nr:hypothetical protein [Pasteurella testudinis]
MPECSIVDYDVIPYVEAALLWCGVEYNDLPEILKEVTEISGGIFKHPYIPCLQKKTRVLDLAISQCKIRAVREHGHGGDIEISASGEKLVRDHVACGRRHFWISDLKKYISENYPDDCPKTIFHADELKPIIDTVEYERMAKEYQKILLENTNFQNKINGLNTKLADKDSEIRDLDLTVQGLSIQLQQSKSAQKDAEDRLDRGRKLYQELQYENLLLKKPKTIDTEKYADTIRLLSIAIPSIPKKGANLTASGLNAFLINLKEKTERETGEQLPFSVPDTKTLQKYLNS